MEDSIKTYWNKTNFWSVKSSLSDLAESAPEIIGAKHSPSLLHFGGPSGWFWGNSFSYTSCSEKQLIFGIWTSNVFVLIEICNFSISEECPQYFQLDFDEKFNQKVLGQDQLLIAQNFVFWYSRHVFRHLVFFRSFKTHHHAQKYALYEFFFHLERLSWFLRNFF